VVITGLLPWTTSISLVSDSTSSGLSYNSFGWQTRTGENKLEMIPRAQYQELLKNNSGKKGHVITQARL